MLCRRPVSSRPEWHGGSCGCVSGSNWVDGGQKLLFGNVQFPRTLPEPRGNALSFLLLTLGISHLAPLELETGGIVPSAPQAPDTVDIVHSLLPLLGKAGISLEVPLELDLNCISPLALLGPGIMDTDPSVPQLPD